MSRDPFIRDRWTDIELHLRKGFLIFGASVNREGVTARCGAFPQSWDWRRWPAAWRRKWRNWVAGSGNRPSSRKRRVRPIRLHGPACWTVPNWWSCHGEIACWFIGMRKWCGSEPDGCRTSFGGRNCQSGQSDTKDGVVSSFKADDGFQIAHSHQGQCQQTADEEGNSCRSKKAKLTCESRTCSYDNFFKNLILLFF